MNITNTSSQISNNNISFQPPLPDKEHNKLQKMEPEKESEEEVGNDCGNGGRERLKKHRREMAGRVWIPEMWGQEEFLKDWIDCSTFDNSLVPNGISSARAALVEEARRVASASASASSGLQRIDNRCLILP